jgi:hypothetical protein
VKDNKAVFYMTTVTGKKIVAKDGEFAWEDNETQVEWEIRKLASSMKSLEDTFKGLPEDEVDGLKEAINYDKVMESSKEKFEKLKEELVKQRIEKSKVHRQYYHEGKLHIFYDIKHGNNVDRFCTLEEIEKMKDDFARADFHNNYKPKVLDHLQAFDENFNLVIDEWEM